VALQNIPYGLIRNRVTEIGQRAHNAVVPVGSRYQAARE
jgi:hypothetical protein